MSSSSSCVCARARACLCLRACVRACARALVCRVCVCVMCVCVCRDPRESIYISTYLALALVWRSLADGAARGPRASNPPAVRCHDPQQNHPRYLWWYLCGWLYKLRTGRDELGSARHATPTKTQNTHTQREFKSCGRGGERERCERRDLRSPVSTIPIYQNIKIYSWQLEVLSMGMGLTEYRVVCGMYRAVRRWSLELSLRGIDPIMAVDGRWTP